MDPDSTPLKPEWSHRIDVATLGARPHKLTLTATAEERKDLARRLRVQAIDLLEAVITVAQEPGSALVHVEGRVRGHVVQTCVTTQQPVHEDVVEDFETWYADPTQAVPFVKARRERLIKGEREREVLPERDDPDLVTDGFIDVAELATQYLSLGINPYPRAGDSPGPAQEAGEEALSAPRKNPFAALKDWKIKQGREK